MKFSVKAWSKGGARAGVLQVGGCSLETPALLLTTRKGLPAFISPDLLSSLPTPDSRLLQFSPLHFLEGISLKAISEMGGLHQMLSLRGHVFAANPADSILSIPDYQSSTKHGASFETPSGRFTIQPGKYVEMISSMKPNMWITLADEVPAWVSEKRNRSSVARTLRWLDDCLTSSTANNTGGAVFGSIVGGSRINERRYCAQQVSNRNVSGFHIGGFGSGESMDERPTLLSVVTECLPEDKPRQISGLGLPEEILQGVAAGIDLFNSTYIYHLTLGGFALTFSSEEIERRGFVNQLSDSVRDDGTKINLKATIYRKDTSPILEGCKCYTCQNHTKAYLNHLFNVHEMLALILLEIHNTHHYLGFFHQIRVAIKKGTFEQFRQNFVKSRREHDVAAADPALAVAMRVRVWSVRDSKAVDSDVQSIYGVIAMLESSPNLRNLDIRGYKYLFDNATLLPALITRDDLNCDMLHLKTVKLNNFFDSDDSGEPTLTLARILLKRAPVLEKMTVYKLLFKLLFSVSEVNTMSDSIKKTLLDYPKSSTIVSVEFSTLY